MKKILLTVGLVSALFAGSQVFMDGTYGCITTDKLDNNGDVVYKLNDKQKNQSYMLYIKKGDILIAFKEKVKFEYSRTYKGVDEYMSKKNMNIYIYDTEEQVGDYFFGGLSYKNSFYKTYCKRIK